MMRFHISKKQPQKRNPFFNGASKRWISSRPLFQMQTQEVERSKVFHEQPYPKISLEKLAESITAQHIIQGRPKKVISIPENTRVYDALQIMNEKDIGCILVDRFSGGFSIFTETDYVRKIALMGLSSKTTEIAQVANPHVVTISPNTTIEKMSNLMMQDGIHHLPVVEFHGQPNSQVTVPIAVISSRDVASHFVEVAKQATDYSLEGNLQNVFENLGRRSSQDIWLDDDNSVYEAIKKMTDNRIGAILVNTNNQFTGIFTERDYLNKIILKGRSSKQTALKDVMTRKPFFIPADSMVKDCLNFALNRQIRHIPIVTLAGNEINMESIVGMVTINDIIAYLMLELEVKRMKTVSPDLH